MSSRDFLQKKRLLPELLVESLQLCWTTKSFARPAGRSNWQGAQNLGDDLNSTTGEGEVANIFPTIKVMIIISSYHGLAAARCIRYQGACSAHTWASSYRI